MTDYEETEAIWSGIPGADAALEVYGYYPSMHDAQIVRIEVDRALNSVTGWFHYNDLPHDAPDDATGDDDIYTVISIRWKGVTRFDCEFTDRWLYRMTFSQTPEGITTALVEWETGLPRCLAAQSIEVVEVERVSRDWARSLGNDDHTVFVVMTFCS